MAFKSLSQYQEDKQGEFFVLPNDGDFADVVFLYKSVADVLVADVHWISSTSYTGYAFCLGRGDGCPACNYPTQNGRGLRRDSKIFIPLYNISKNKIEFWDRSTFFEQVLQKSVFKPYPDPSQVVFRITRQGDAGSRDTRYNIVPIAKNTAMPYEKILADLNVTLPDYYSIICKDMTSAEMSAALNSTAAASNLEDYGYVPIPRGTVSTEEMSTPTVPTPEYSAPPEVAPPSVSDLLPDYSEDLPTPGGAEDSESDDSSDSLDDVKF